MDNISLYSINTNSGGSAMKLMVFMHQGLHPRVTLVNGGDVDNVLIPENGALKPVVTMNGAPYLEPSGLQMNWLNYRRLYKLAVHERFV